MDNIIEPKYYEDKKIFKKDLESFCSDLWLFVGLKSEIPKKNDYFTQKLGLESIIVYNSGHCINVFHNMCKHRHSAIKLNEKGNGKLICPYHNWHYDCDGKLKNIPDKKNNFPDIGENEFSKIKLTKWKVECCGEFIFAKKFEDNNSLQKSLGKAFDFLKSISIGLGELFFEHKFIINANWKLIIENTLENYHVNSVHPKSFKRLGIHDLMGDSFNGNVWSNAKISEKMLKQWKHINRIFKNRPFKTNGWDHLVLFPKTAIATTFGISFSITNLFPISSDKTLFISKVYFTKIINNKKYEKLIIDLKKTIIEFNKTVFEEDAKAAEGVQKVIGESTEPIRYGTNEKRIIPFLKKYKEIILRN